MEKSELIKTLNDEILSATPEEELESEVESVDATQERISLAVMRINCFLTQTPPTAFEAPPTSVTGSSPTTETPPGDTPDDRPSADACHSPHTEDIPMHISHTPMHAPPTDFADSSPVSPSDDSSLHMHTLHTHTHTLAAPWIRLPDQ